MTTTPQAALLSDAAKLADEYRVTMPREVLASWGAEVQTELRRLDALVAHLTADRDDTANELALRTKHNLALTNERDQLLAKLQATQELVQAGSASLLDGCKSIMDSIAVSSSVIEHNKQAEPVQAGELPALPHDGWPARFRCDSCDGNGEIGELISMGHFQPPERQTCPDCGGRGWSDEGPAFNADHMRDYARAVLSARKPLTMLEPTQIADACAGIYASDHAGKAYDQAVAIAAITEFCRINGIGLEVKP